jgi:DNA-binding NtrC family response regulator
MPRILLVEDEPQLRLAVETLLRARGYEVIAVPSGEEALAVSEAADLAVLDLLLPGLSGTEVMAELRKRDAKLPCLLITAHASIQSAVQAIKSGAYDYLAKPFDNDDLLQTIARALEHRRLSARVSELEEDLSARASIVGIVGRSEPVRHLLRQLARVAGSQAAVLICGETGTGKELAARSLHQGSARRNAPFVAVNCAAIPKDLAESELFGHVRGAFTDAKTDRFGRFEEADSGTLFLDEVGELPLEVQAKLLRVVQDRHVTRLGSSRQVRVDVRLIAATNRDLEQEMSAGRFRADLFYRLNVVQLDIPPLRERRQDLPLLISHLLTLANAECRTAFTGLTPEAEALVESYSWPGNIRELANAIRRGVLLGDAPLISVEDLPPAVLKKSADSRPATPTGDLRESMAAAEKMLVEATLERFKGNRTAAAKALGIDRRTLYTKLQPRRSQER